MLAILTITTDLVAMAVTLWMAFYLFARGFPNRIAMRAVLSLLAISLFFLGTYNGYFFHVPGTANLRAGLLIIGMACWYSVTFNLLSQPSQQKFRWLEIAVYSLSFVTVVFLIVAKPEFIRQQGNDFYVAYLEGTFVYVLYGATQIIISLGLIFNLMIEKRIRFTAQGRFFLFATIFPTLAVLYGALAVLFDEPPMPRLIQDGFVFAGVFMLGISVALHQSLLERRTILQDFPAAGLTMLAVISFYVLLGRWLGIQVASLGFLVLIAITTHSVYDLSREFLERLRIRKDGQFRRKLRLIEGESANEQKLQTYLQDGLDHLCSILNTTSGMVAVRRDGKIVVTASRNSVEVGSDVSAALSSSEDMFRPNGNVKNISWAASAFEGQNQLVVVGVGASKTKLDYSTGDLDLFAEFTDHVGTLISIGSLQPQTNKQIIQLVEESQTFEMSLDSAAGEMMETLSSDVDAGFVKVVEDALRKFSDFIVLGQSAFAEWANVKGSSHIERGKQVQKILRIGVETLRPAEVRPPEPLPRVWYNYVVLHDAYVKGVMNREVMARLYISEGTFNRTRRNALRGVARWLMEENKAGKI
ncbi:MAG: hypothetical protein KA138_10585 [Saprospiraceae bacterium]|nr:hypothetical protein [Saprospiraceae bacterium]